MAETRNTRVSMLSACSQRVLQDVGKKSKTRLFQMQNEGLNDQTLNLAWDSFGKFISAKLRQGRGVKVPNFGVFTFSAPFVTLNGVTNPKVRDRGNREPVFLISPQFFRGGQLKTARFCRKFKVVRPYNAKGVNGVMHLTKCNFTQIGMMAGSSKDEARTAIERVIKELAADTRKRGACEMIIPTVGVFGVKSKLAAVAFDDGLYADSHDITNKNFTPNQRKGFSNNFVTIDNMDKFALSQSGYNVKGYEGRFMSLDDQAKSYLKELNINPDTLPQGRDFRPMTATCDYDHLSISRQSKSRSRNMRKRGSASSSQSNFRKTKGTNFRTTTKPGFYNHPHSIKMLSKKFAQTVSPKQRKLDLERLISIAKRKIGLWIRENKMPVIDTFFEIISRELGKNVMRAIEVNPDLFAKCLFMMEIGIDEKSGLALAQDIGKGQKITAMMFSDYMEVEDTDMINKLRDVIYVNGLRFEDLMKTLNITNESALLDFFSLRDGIRRIDPSLTAEQAKILSAEILKGRDQITVYDLIECLEGISEEEGPHQLHQNIMMLNQIRIKLLEHVNPEILRERFEKMDDNNNGLLDPASFKTCLLKLRDDLGLSIGQINRLGRYIPKKNGFIDYNDFLKRLNTELIKLSLRQSQSLNGDSLYDLENLALDIKGYLKEYGINVRRFLVRAMGNDDNIDDEELQYINTNMQVNTFADFVCRVIYSDSQVSDVTISYYINKIDIDKDGYIDAEDLRAFLDRFDLLENKKDRLAETLYNSFNVDATKELDIPLKKSLYPLKEIKANKVDAVLRNLRNSLGNRNISFREFFMRIDVNKDGLVTYDEFKDGIRDIADFSDPIIKGLFAYMDRQHIGMIDFNNYLRVMKKSVLDDLKEGPEDNFDWQIDVIKQIKNWFYSKELTSEDAFRMIDTDFDNEINKVDLRRFLETVLMIPEEEVSSPRLDRLFNLLDQYKRSRITYEDFRRLLADDFVPSDNPTMTGGLENDKHGFDWLLNARQKIGIYISKKYKNLKDCFDEVSCMSNRITYEQFKKWIEPRGILHGFNLTELLLRELFSDIDPHKKGHLTENDWVNAFGSFDHISIYLSELKELIASNFSTPGDAFVFFSRHGPNRSAFNKACFKRAVNTLIPKRFSSGELEKLWARLAGNSASINRNYFIKYFSEVNFDGCLSLTGSKIQKSRLPGISNSKTYTTKLKSIEPDKSDVISKMRQFIKASHKTIRQIFNDIDQSGLGVVTNLEFKQGIRKLLIGLTSKEIDDLINVVDMNKDGRVDWVEFNNRFKEHDSDWRILDRTRQRLHWIKDQIYLFMLSPKDAFRQFNTNRTGKMTFEHFENFLESLCSMSAEKAPNFVVKKDLFNYFDSKKDGFIDLTEWQQVFKRIEVPIKSRHLQHIVLNPDGNDISKFEISHEFDNIISVIARNRRFLVTQFRQMERRGIPINFKTVRAVLAKLLRGQCITVPDNCWPLLISFAEKDGFIDYRYLLDRYKERISNLYSYPTVKGSGA